MTLSLIVAADLNNGIGIGGRLPWHLKGDMEHFKKTTLHHAVIMGRKTWDSLPEKFKPLPQRQNIVLTRGSFSGNAEKAASLEEAVKAAKSEEVFVIGGGEIYKVALLRHDCTMIYMTRVMAVLKCDTFFPKIDGFYEFSNGPNFNENGLEYKFSLFKRLKGSKGFADI